MRARVRVSACLSASMPAPGSGGDAHCQRGGSARCLGPAHMHDRHLLTHSLIHSAIMHLLCTGILLEVGAEGGV
jgi:hypothetical protein